MAEPMSKERLKEIAARCEAYKKYCEKGTHSADCCVRETRKAMLRDNYSEYFANLAAHAPYDIPALFAEIERQAGEIERMRETESDETCGYCNGEKNLIRVDDTVIYIHFTPEVNAYQLVIGNVSRGGWIVGQEIKRCPMCGRPLPQGPEVEG